ncbi:acyltransferase domain-containing protein [Kribbella catacumbae]|uniref:acyltransferase domain-containing protein n=1 Tax=Kribbella catacumbae TaxID=460086 RepID=UPI00037262A2|nr:acyltransferase domain-containing protein [Kribbella catacumbae]
MGRLFNVTTYDFAPKTMLTTMDVALPVAAETAAETVLLFPGQGAYDEAALRAARPALNDAREVFERIDAVAARMDPSAARVCETVLAPSPPSLTKLCTSEKDLLQLTLFGLSVALFETLKSAGVRPASLVGHSFGEIAALVCGGMFTLEQGAEIVCHRNAALRAVADQPGAMAAVGCSAERARAMLTVLDQTETAVAAENSPKQSVVSGPDEYLAAIEKLARAASISFLRLQAPYGFHSPLMAPVAKAFEASLSQLKPGRLSIPVYSPILGRWYEDGEDMAPLLASHLIRPVYFGDALRRVWENGSRVFVECGARSTLSGLVGQSLPDATRVTCLDGDQAARFPQEQVTVLRGLGQLPTALDDQLAELVLPGVPTERAQDFWNACGHDVLAQIRQQYKAFSKQDEPNHKLLEPQPEVQPVRREPAPDSIDVALPDRAELAEELAAFYAEALEYPVEVITEDAELEGDLGVDSVKQTELIARVAERYGLPERPENFRLSDYPTLGKVVDFVSTAEVSSPAKTASAPEVGGAAKAGSAQPAEVSAGSRALPDRDGLTAELAVFYAEALEYPVEVITEDAELEADLGVDSVKQTELIARVAERYGLPERPENFRLSDYPTLGKVVDFVSSAAAERQMAA